MHFSPFRNHHRHCTFQGDGVVAIPSHSIAKYTAVMRSNVHRGETERTCSALITDVLFTSFIETDVEVDRCHGYSLLVEDSEAGDAGLRWSILLNGI